MPLLLLLLLAGAVEVAVGDGDGEGVADVAVPHVGETWGVEEPHELDSGTIHKQSGQWVLRPVADSHLRGNVWQQLPQQAVHCPEQLTLAAPLAQETLRPLLHEVLRRERIPGVTSRAKLA